MINEIEQKLSNINDNLIHLSEQMSEAETKVFIPQLENTNVILKSLRNNETRNVILQNDKAIQIETINPPNNLDYMTAWGTLGAVIVSLLLGVVIPFIKKCIDWWNQRVKVKLKFIEYYYDEDKDIPPAFFVDLKNLYNHQLHIKRIFFFIEFKGIVLPIILRLQSKGLAVMPPLSETGMECYISADICQDEAAIIENEKELIEHINRHHIRRNKISPFDKIKNVYLSLDTNLGQFKIRIPNWMRDASSDNIIALFMQDVFISPKEIKTKENSHNLLEQYISETKRRYSLGKKKRKRELLKWKIEELCNHFPFLDIFFEKFINSKDEK